MTNEREVYSKEQIEFMRKKFLELIGIVAELEDTIPDRHFTLDGHLVGSIGEVMAAYYYGIELYKASAKVHDGIVDNKEVQIKITQGNSVVIKDEPDYLIVLYLSKNGDFYEVYNGPGKLPLETASKPDSYNHRHMRLNKLMELDADVLAEDRIKQKHLIEKMKKEYKNKKK